MYKSLCFILFLSPPRRLLLELSLCTGCQLLKTSKLLVANSTPFMNSTEVQNPRRKLEYKCLCLSCVWFCSCLCKVYSRVSEALLLALRTLSLTNNSSSDSKAFLSFIAFSGSLTAVHCPLHALRYYTVSIPF